MGTLNILSQGKYEQGLVGLVYCSFPYIGIRCTKIVSGHK